MDRSCSDDLQDSLRKNHLPYLPSTKHSLWLRQALQLHYNVYGFKADIGGYHCWHRRGGSVCALGADGRESCTSSLPILQNVTDIIARQCMQALFETWSSSGSRGSGRRISRCNGSLRKSTGRCRLFTIAPVHDQPCAAAANYYESILISCSILIDTRPDTSHERNAGVYGYSLPQDISQLAVSSGYLHSQFRRKTTRVDHIVEHHNAVWQNE